MSKLTGYANAFVGDTSQIDDSDLQGVGTRGFDVDGNEYIYLQGVASTVAGNFVSFDESYVTTRIVANAVGRVAIAMAAIVANQYGWYQIYGKNTIATTDTILADAPLYIDGTAGRADDAAVAGDLIHGCVSRSADTSNVATVEINYPFVNDGAYLV